MRIFFMVRRKFTTKHRYYNKFLYQKSNIIFFKINVLYKKIASNTISQILSKMITALISIFLIGILTKYLPMELYGSYNKIYSYLGIFAFLADLWLYTITIREISQAEHKKEKIIGNVLSLRTLLWIAIWILAFIIALFLPGYNNILSLCAICIVGAFTLVSLINSSLLALMQSQMKMEFSLLSLVAWKLINLSLIALFLIFIFTDTSLTNVAFLSVFIAGFLGICLNTYMNYRYAQKIVDISYRWDWEYIKYIFKISLPYGIALFLSVVYFKVDVILLSLLESPEKADISIALYGLPMKIIEVLMVLWGFYLNSLLPSLTQKYTQKKFTEISHILWLSLKILASFWFCIFLVGHLFARETIAIIATDEYISPIGHIFNSVQALQVVLAVLLFYFLSLTFIYILIASQRQSLLLWINIIVTIFNIIGNIMVIPYYSFLGSAYITLCSQILLFILSSFIVLRSISLPIQYIASIGVTTLYGGLLYALFYNFDFWRQWGDISIMLSIVPVFLIFYSIGEYIFSWKLIRKSLSIVSR